MRKRIALSCTVWGADFTDFFCRYSVASLLTPTNIPAACEAYDLTLLLYTSADDLAQMQRHPNFCHLQTLIKVEPVMLDALPASASRGHWLQWQHSMLSADRFSAVILIIPDCLYADDAIVRTAEALETHDLVYYCIPQICLELALPQIEAETRPSASGPRATCLDFSSVDIASLVVKYITPRYAVALHRPDYFVTHPEYILRAAKGRLEIHELTCHPLAVGSSANGIAYAMNPLSAGARIAFLDLLAVGVEYTFKYFEQYYRWPSSHMQASRHSLLSSWYYSFNQQGAKEYSKTKTVITIEGAKAVAQSRAEVTDPRIKYTRMAFDFYAACYAVYAGPAASCGRDVREAIALAMALPGFRKAVMKRQRPLTVLLPAPGEASAVLEILFGTGDARRLFSFLAMHVVPGRLTLAAGQSFVLEKRVDAAPDSRRFRIVDAELADTLSAPVVGRITSQAIFVTDDVLAYTASIRYGSKDNLISELSPTTQSVSVG